MDWRVLALAVDAHGQQHRDFRDAVLAMQEVALRSWPVRGPRTLLYVLKYLADHGPTPIAWHPRWQAHYGLSDGDEGVAPHLMLCRALHYAVVFDQGQIVNQAAFEVMGRELQLLEERQRERNAHGEPDGESYLYSGLAVAGDHTCVSPALREWISEELRKDAALMKERRKAREEREVAKPKAGPKRRGKNGGARDAAGDA